jgi:hypothetical protein
MSNNIYNILNSFGKVAQEAQPLVESKQEKKTTLLESTMESILAERFAEFKESGYRTRVGAEVSPEDLKKYQADPYAAGLHGCKCNPHQKGTPESAKWEQAYQDGDMDSKTHWESREPAAEPVMEKAPPGMEDLVMKLKKQYPGHEDKAFATAWSIYNKKHGKKESVEEASWVDGKIGDPKDLVWKQTSMSYEAAVAEFGADHVRKEGKARDGHTVIAVLVPRGPVEEAKEKPMNAFHPDYMKKEKEKEGTGKFDKKKISTGTVYTKKSEKPDYIDLDNDGDTDEPMKKAAKDKKAGEKRGRGRPRKNESLLDSLMNEYDSALTFNESDDLEQDQLRQHIGDDLYSKAVAYVKAGADGFNFPPDLFDALMDYYMNNGEMPYEVAKARDGDPYEWLSDKLEQLLGNVDSDDNRPEVDDVDPQPEGDVDQEPIPQESMNMNESVKDIAKLAGLLTESVGDIPPTQREPLTLKTAGASDAKSTYKVKTPQGYKYYDDAETADKDAQLYKSKVEFNEDEMEEGNEFSGALAKAKATGAKEFEVDGKTYQVESLDECGEMVEAGEKKDAFTVTATYNGAEGTQTINVNADGETAEQLAQLLKLSGLMGGKQEQVYHPVQVQVAEPQEVEIEEDSRYEASTTPDEHILPTDALTKGGDGEVAGKEKPQHKDGAARFSDNPLAMEETDPFAQLGEELMAEYESIKTEASYSAKAARAGKDIGQHGKNFAKISADAAKRYGSKEKGQKVAGAVLAKLRK